MPLVFSRVPLTAVERIVAPGGVPIALRPFQLVVWVRLIAWKSDEPSAGIAFPSVLDTGNNGTVLMPETIFRAVSENYRDELIGHHTAIVNGVLLHCYRFNLDLLQPRGRTQLERVAMRLQTDRGIYVIPRELEHRFPRLPIIGVRCLTTNRLTISLNGNRRTFSLWRPAAPKIG